MFSECLCASFFLILTQNILQLLLYNMYYTEILCGLSLLGEKHELNFGFSYLTSTNRKKYILIGIKMSLFMNVNIIFINKNERLLVCS